MFKPNFTITSDILNQIAGIERIRAIVDKSVILPEREISLRYRYTVEAIHSSTSIEGNPLDRKQIEAVLAGKKVSQSKYALTEVINYKRALDFIRERSLSEQPICLDDILHLHRLVSTGLLPKEKSGEIRPGDIFIVDSIDGVDHVRYTGPEATQVPKLLSELLDWLVADGSTLHPVLSAGILHLEFVSIHPFSDGNGRMARLLTMLYLGLRDFDFRGVLVPETYYLENRMAYYTALSSAQGEKYSKSHRLSMDPWLQYFVSGLLAVAKELNANIGLAAAPANTGIPIKLSRDEIVILDYVRQFGSIDLNTATEILARNQRTVQRRLENLVAKKLLLMKRAGKNTEYTLGAQEI
jgi:Fic family protein